MASRPSQNPCRCHDTLRPIWQLQVGTACSRDTQETEWASLCAHVPAPSCPSHRRRRSRPFGRATPCWRPTALPVPVGRSRRGLCRKRLSFLFPTWHKWAHPHQRGACGQRHRSVRPHQGGWAGPRMPATCCRSRPFTSPAGPPQNAAIQGEKHPGGPKASRRFTNLQKRGVLKQVCRCASFIAARCSSPQPVGKCTSTAARQLSCAGAQMSRRCEAMRHAAMPCRQTAMQCCRASRQSEGEEWAFSPGRRYGAALGVLLGHFHESDLPTNAEV